LESQAKGPSGLGRSSGIILRLDRLGATSIP